MKLFLSAALALLAMTSATPDDDLQREFDEWQAKFGARVRVAGLVPATTNKADMLARFKATKESLVNLKRDNPHANFTVMTPFALLTDDEFTAFVNRGFHQDNIAPERRLRSEATNWANVAASTSAGSVDWTTSKCVNPVQNQGSCGSCWTFSATGAVESAHCIATGQLLKLSEQELVSCATSAGDGCRGGLHNRGINWIVDNGGQCLASDYPYTSGRTKRNGSCQRTCQVQKLSVGHAVDISGEDALESALNKQPVAVAVEAGNPVWKQYQDGIVTRCPGRRSDHAVIAVGYGERDGQAYWKIRNSWGATFGEEGHILLARGVGGKGMCNVAEFPTYPQILGGDAPSQSSDGSW